MKSKRYVPVLMAGCLLLASFPANVTAAAIQPAKTIAAASASDSAKEATKEELEKILTSVKARIDIPEEYTEFDYNYTANSSDASVSWSFNWHNKEASKYIYIQADGDGNILSYSLYNNENSSYQPEYLKTELESTAKDFIKKAAPDIYGKIKYVSAQSQGMYSGQYTYCFERVENGIAMPDNKVYVGVNFETGKVESYTSNWLYKVEVPSADVMITKEEAAKIIGKNITMKLSYQSAYTTDEKGNNTIKAFLVYAPDKTYIAVDAKTGKVYTTQNEWNGMIHYGAKETAQSNADTAAGTGLTNEEIKEIDGLTGIISSKEAINAVKNNKNLLLDDSLTSVAASLYKEEGYAGSKDTKYVWNISLSDPRQVDYNTEDTYRAYASATVDARTGELLSFSASVKDRNSMSEKELKSIKVKYTQQQGQKIFEDFLNKQVPDKFKNSVLTDKEGSYIIAYKGSQSIYGGYSYNYDRVYKDIPYPNNGIYGSVDGVTGKIYSYYYNWSDDVTFEAPDNIISASKAFDYYIANDGYTLAYEINNINSDQVAENVSGTAMAIKIASGVVSPSYSKEYEIRLVYRTDISPEYISPFTGKQLNYDGKEYTEPGQSYTYSDIRGCSSARNILLLADNGIGFEGGKYLPNQAITGKELKDFLSLSNIYFNSGKYELKAENGPVTRMEAAKYVVQILGYDDIASLKDIYNVNFSDKDKIAKDDLGYAAIAQGLQLITGGSDNAFRPDENLTRAEAADLLMAILARKK